ncbi:uncharacterized protein KY384_002267 [Bacidia gigantensis]|uniref:uncharacterized protein n=1 Tax=Bacidia gigantensis TaxID=2732470 RepID=UPI001D044911|nr:uncharacterized protein KY384_002267 [Bacidia gigantensis]KAG8533484.1 hypothetical protein KY384_002267 [Bacidia gigantensis]
MQKLKGKLDEFRASASRDSNAQNSKTPGIDPDWIDLETIRNWKWVCDTEHGDRCASSATSGESSGPRWLIDVQKNCIVPADHGAEYAALSYVWGNLEMLKLSQENLMYLLEEGAILAHADWIPRTIRDAIGFVSCLGIKYLWVDCLCIVQDDEDSKHSQIQNMGNIYAQASVTVIAANGWDAEHGLRGVREVTQVSRNLTYRSQSQDFYESMQPYSSVWYSRGWTFQELVFARRKLMFQYKVVLWECNCATWHEATGLEEMPTLYHTAMKTETNRFTMGRWGRNIEFQDWPDIRQYIDLPRDPLIRRSKDSFSSSDAIALPSWSWVGWRGSLDSREWLLQFDHLSEGRFGFNVTSSVKWSYGCLEADTSIEQSSHKYRNCMIDRDAPLPIGWRRVNYDGAPSKGVNYYFVHQSCPDIRYKYPIPFLEVRGSPQMLNLGGLLCGRTMRSFFRIPGDEYVTHANEATCIRTRMLDVEHSEWAGILVLNDTRHFIHSQQVELVWIATGEDMNGLLDDARSREGVPGIARESKSRWETNSGALEFYHVMWIGWSGGVAHRKALGWVLSSAWHNQPIELIDLVLG